MTLGNQLRFHNKVTKTIGIKIRDASFNTKSRRISIDHFIDSDDEICFYALKIFDVFYNDQPIRLIGCMAEGCIDKGKETLVKKDEQLTMYCTPLTGPRSNSNDGWIPWNPSIGAAPKP